MAGNLSLGPIIPPKGEKGVTFVDKVSARKFVANGVPRGYLRPMFLRRLLFVLSLVPLPLGAWQAKQFPVKAVKISALFGESRGDHFHSGIDFAGVQEVRPVDEGEVIFASDTQVDPCRQGLGIGNHVVVEHEGAFRSAYMHLEAGSVARNLDRVKLDDTLGRMGDTGYSMGAHLHLVVEDTKGKALINPLKVLPDLADEVRPQIAAFLGMVAGNSKPFRFRDYFTFHWRGEVRLFIQAWDLRQGFDPWRFRTVSEATGTSIRRIALRVDDRLLREYDFSVMRKTPQGLKIDPGYTHDETYGIKFNYRMGSFTPSEPLHTFDISIEDFAGNVTSERARIVFRQ